MKAAPIVLSRFSVRQHGRSWRSCRFPVSSLSGSDCCSCPVRGQYPDVHGIPRQSEQGIFLCRPKPAFHQQNNSICPFLLLGIVETIIVLSSSDTSELTLLYVLRNVAVCPQKWGFIFVPKDGCCSS